MFIIYTFIFILIVFFAVTSMPTFGRLPKGERLGKIQVLPNYAGGALQNLSDTPMQPEGVSFFKVLRKFFFNKQPDKLPKTALPFVLPDLNSKPLDQDAEIIWFGHSSYLLKIGNFRILVDPVFSRVVSPFSFVGSKAFAGTQFVKAEDFKNIDVLVITHDHYDHLDYKTILTIAPEARQIVTSLGVGEHLESWGINADKIKELQWNGSCFIYPDLQITAVPARHFTGRKFKRNQTLWSAFALQTSSWKIFVGGDSGYDSHFAKIGQEQGPFDLAILECGQYDAYWPYIHMFPEQTVQAAMDLKAKVLMPVHWGKFSLAMHPWNDPVIRVVKAAKENNQQIIIPKLGQTTNLNHNEIPIDQWWLSDSPKQ